MSVSTRRRGHEPASHSFGKEVQAFFMSCPLWLLYLAHADVTAHSALCLTLSFLCLRSLTRAKGLHRTSLWKSGQSVSYIFRNHLGRVPKGAMQGGRGVVTRKRGENSFSLDPFVLIFSVLGFLVLENFIFFFKAWFFSCFSGLLTSFPAWFLWGTFAVDLFITVSYE